MADNSARYSLPPVDRLTQDIQIGFPDGRGLTYAGRSNLALFLLRLEGWQFPHGRDMVRRKSTGISR